VLRWLIVLGLFWYERQPSELARARVLYLERRQAAEGGLAALEWAHGHGRGDEYRLAADRARASIEAAQDAFERGMTEGNPAHVYQAVELLKLSEEDADLAEGVDYGA